MFKLKTILLIGVVVAVAACGGQAPTTPVAPPTAVATIAPTATAPAATAVVAPTQPSGGLAITPAGVASAPKLDPAGMCKATVAPQPEPNFPATTPADHSRGTDGAPIVLYEYSDFQ